jgi:hypothetical protein
MKKYSIKSVAAMAIAGLALLIGLMAPTAAAAAPVNVYRFYNSHAGAHFYTASDDEKASVQRNLSKSLTYEGVSYTMDDASPAATQNLYRFYNVKTGTHFYTASDAERDTVLAGSSSTYRYEGVAYKVSPVAAEGAVAVYRFYNHRVGGVHFYTASAEERDRVIARVGSTYTYEGIAYYVPMAPAAPVAAAPVPAVADESALAQTILDGLKAQYPRYLGAATVEFGNAAGYQAISYYTAGRIVISPTHTATLKRILDHEVWHIIDWQDNNAIDWGEAIPPADMATYAD